MSALAFTSLVMRKRLWTSLGLCFFPHPRGGLTTKRAHPTETLPHVTRVDLDVGNLQPQVHGTEFSFFPTVTRQVVGAGCLSPQTGLRSRTCVFFSVRIVPASFSSPVTARLKEGPAGLWLA